MKGAPLPRVRGAFPTRLLHATDADVRKIQRARLGHWDTIGSSSGVCLLGFAFAVLRRGAVALLLWPSFAAQYHWVG